MSKAFRSSFGDLVKKTLFFDIASEIVDVA